MKAELKTIEFKFERTIAAEPGEVFNAWLDPKVPGNPWNMAEKLLLNPVVDGFFYWAARGTAHYGRFTEILRGAKMVHTWVSPNTLGHESTVTVTFEKKGSGTIMTLVHAGLPDHELARGHEKGWNYFLGIFRGSLGVGRVRMVRSGVTMANAVESRGYAPVNGLKMYYEVEGTGEALVYIPGAFGFAGLNTVAKLLKNRRVITVDLQGHGRTADIVDRAMSFEQHAKDVVGLLAHLGIERADFLGESFGGLIATLIAVRQPKLVRRLMTYGAVFGKPMECVREDILKGHVGVTAESRGIQFNRENFKRVSPEPGAWARVYEKVGSQQTAGFSKEELAGIGGPFLIMQGDHDFVRIEHSVETYRSVPNGELAIIPDAGHFVLHSEPGKVVPVIETFLGEADVKVPFADAVSGYHPGETR